MKIRMTAMDFVVGYLDGLKGIWIPDGVCGDGYLVDPWRWFLWKAKNELSILYLGMVLDWRRETR